MCDVVFPLQWLVQVRAQSDDAELLEEEAVGSLAALEYTNAGGVPEVKLINVIDVCGMCQWCN